MVEGRFWIVFMIKLTSIKKENNCVNISKYYLKEFSGMLKFV